VAALSDDVNTPAAIAELHKLAAHARSASGAPADAATQLVGSLRLLGFERAFEHVKPSGIREDILKSIQEVKARELGLEPVALDKQIAERLSARKAKDFRESDRIRDELAAMGVVLKDGKDPATGELTTTWEIAR
jgi:cysteinyl-tRNA synthetase